MSYASEIRKLLRRVSDDAEQARERQDWLQLGPLIGLAAMLRSAELAAEKVAQGSDVASRAHVTHVAEEHLP